MVASRRRTDRSRRLRSLAAIVLVFGISVGFRAYVAEAHIVVGSSMEPTYQTDDRVLVAKMVNILDINRGDVVVLVLAGQGRLIKRVVAIPRDHVLVNDIGVYVDGQRIASPVAFGFSPLHTTLAADELFVLGDNRNNSLDSRNFGPVPAEAIVGRVVGRFWPVR